MYLSLDAEAADCYILREEKKTSYRFYRITRLVAMLPYAYFPATYGTMHFTQNSRIYPSAYLVREPLIGSYAGDCITNEPTVRDSAKENHHGDFNSFYIAPTIPTWAREWQLHDPKNASGEHPPKVIMGKEEYLDDVLRNGYKFSKTKTKDQNATATALGPYVVHRSYLRSLKKKKLKSFMVRDLIDLPADDRHSDAFDANLQCQNMQQRTELTPPPEPEIAWKNYELSVPENQRPHDTTINDKPEPYYQGAPCSLTDILKPSFSDPVYDSLQSRLDQSFNGLTSSSDPSICEPSARTAISPDSSDSVGENSEPCSGDSGVSPCAKSKRIRTIFSCSQLERLEMEFERTHYMVGSERSQLAAELNLRESQVKVWFQNRRIKQRKQFHEQQQAILSKIKKSQENDSQAEQENNSNEENALSTTGCEDSSC